MSANATAESELFLQGIPVKLDAGAIEAELARMWKAAEDPGAGTTDSPAATRVCLGNVLWFGTTEGYTRTQKILPGVLSRYPTRTILVERLDHGEGEPIRALVNAQCYFSGKGNPLVCAEVIHLRVARSHLSHVPGLVAPLLLSDLQSTLWYFDPEPYWKSGVAPLAPLVDRLLVEISQEPDMPAALEHMLDGPRPGCALSWFRHRHLREEIASAFDDAAMREMLPRIHAVRFLTPRDRALHRADVLGAALIGGWLAGRLRWKVHSDQPVPGECLLRSPGGEVRISIHPDGPAEMPGLCGAILTDRNGAEITVTISPEDGRVHREVHGSPSGPPSASAVWHQWDDADTVGFALAEAPGYDLFARSARPAAAILRALLAGSTPP